jgi:cytochrome P450
VAAHAKEKTHMSGSESEENIGGSGIHQDFTAVSDMFGSEIEDPHSIYRERRKTTPVMEGDMLAKFKVPSQADYSNLGRPVFTLFKYQDVMAVLRDARTYSSSLLNEGLGQFFGGFMLTAMDGDRHKLARNLLARAFTPAIFAESQIKMKPVARAVIERLAPAKRAELVAAVLLPLPIRLIYEFMGFPADEARMRDFATRAMRILVGPQRDPEKMRISVGLALTAAREIYDDTIEIVRQRRAAGSNGNDLLGYLLRASYDGRTLSDEEITEFIRQLLPAAAETTTRSFGSMLVALLRRPALLARVREDRTLVPKVLNEGMRWETASQFLARQCAVDVEIRGIKIPAGAALSLAAGSANRDEDIFQNADDFDIDRPMRPHVGFGFGAHLCLGMQIAKLEMETILNGLFDCWPNLRLDPDAPAPKILGAQLRGPRSIRVIWD